MQLNPNQFINKTINEIQMHETVCVINFTDGSCLEIDADINQWNGKIEIDYTFTPS